MPTIAASENVMRLARVVRPRILTSFGLRFIYTAPTATLRRPPKSRTPTPGMSHRPLSYGDGPMVWIDCEMTGLDPDNDKILEIAVLITNGNLELVDDGIEFIIRTDKASLDRMDEWCTKQHGQSGLTKACLESPHTKDEVAKAVIDYIKKWVPSRRTGLLAGNSVHADRAFLVKHMPDIMEWLHYRIIDVSSVKELSRRWYPQLGIPKLSESNHRALDDIRGSIKELQWYRQNIFVPPIQPPDAHKKA